MFKALLGKDGTQIARLVDFVKLQGTDPSLWEKPSHCPACKKALVNVNVDLAVLEALGFHEASNEITNRACQKTPQYPHFSHKSNEAAGCPLAVKDDDYFKLLDQVREQSSWMSESQKAEAQAKIESVLRRDEVRQLNAEVMRKFYKDLTGLEKMPDQVRKSLWENTQKLLPNMRVLENNPWLFSYLQILMIGTKKHAFSTGRTHALAFRPLGKQNILVGMQDGVPLYFEAPKAIGLYFDNAREKGLDPTIKNQRGRYKPFKKRDIHVTYEVSENAAQALSKCVLARPLFPVSEFTPKGFERYHL